ncbi:MAG TPA: glycoside hydrolase family 28 protein [Longimicrobiaceae bacterium]|nr:glycoside hydrolase family 28 protein [Longimicrobiaceae bacterium]
MRCKPLLRTLPLALALGPLLPPAAAAQARADSLPADLPAWVHDVGARRTPDGARVCPVSDYGAVPDTSRTSTWAIQAAIDACSAAGGGTVTFAPGRYLTGSIFVKSNVDLRIDQGVVLYGSQDTADYPARPTRVAGIEMSWPAGLINVDGQQNVRISGGGIIDGQGKKWWDAYWALRRDYEPRGLRWAADYDARRPRLMVVSNASDVTIQNLHLKRSGFWTVHVLYSDHVTVDGITISDNAGPSTDGIDIDSSSRILVENNDIDNNDDDICLKAGRDSDGLRVNRPTEYVLIRNNVARRGGGVVSFGSETSGGIRHVVAYHNRGIGTKEGIRFKSARTRGGFVEDVLIRDLSMIDVPRPFTFTLDWNPSYSYATIPAGMTDVPAYWKVLATPVVPAERGLADFRDITIENVRAVGARQIFTASGLPTRPLRNVKWKDVTVVGREAGSIDYARDWQMQNVTLLTHDGKPVEITHGQDVDPPTVVR